jgi:hypothetical protein
MMSRLFQNHRHTGRPSLQTIIMLKTLIIATVRREVPSASPALGERRHHSLAFSA